MASDRLHLTSRGLKGCISIVVLVDLDFIVQEREIKLLLKS